MKKIDHFKQDGTCDCPKDGNCLSCGIACNDHDLVADYYWCGPCLNKSLEEYKNTKRNNGEAI